MQHDPRQFHPSNGASADLLSLRASMGRRRMLGLLSAAASAAVLAACGSDSSGDTSSSTGATGATGATEATTTTAATTATTATGTATTDIGVTPEETGGPFPADGSNDNGEGTTANVLADPGSVRSDIRTDIGGANEQAGVPMTLSVTVLDAATDTPKAGAAVYVWHCNQAGQYSQYNSSMLGGDFSDFSWLRGVQIADATGTVTFTTILPGRYQGRAAHIHFEVFEDGTYGSKLLTSQMAFDDDGVDALYAAAGYTDALAFDTDNADDQIFGDGVEDQLLTITGDVTSGLAATLTVGV